jgi:hypothetical protein
MVPRSRLARRNAADEDDHAADAVCLRVNRRGMWVFAQEARLSRTADGDVVANLERRHCG